MFSVKGVAIFPRADGPGPRAVVTFTHLDESGIVGVKHRTPVETVGGEVEPATALLLVGFVGVQHFFRAVLGMVAGQHDAVLLQ